MNKEVTETDKLLMQMPLFQVFNYLRRELDNEKYDIGMIWKFKDCEFEVICREV